MSQLLKRADIESVFTPRNRLVNNEMYVKRPDLEKNLLRALNGHMHVMLFGESGNGKSWLYKHVLQQKELQYYSANCGSAARVGSITQEIVNCCLPEGHLKKISTEQSKEAGANISLFSAKLEATNIFELHKDEPLLAAFKFLKEKHERTILVIENLEAIGRDEKLISELCNIILLLDDERYAACNVKFLIVGTPNGVIDFFGQSQNLSSVSNRIQEASKVSGFDIDQIRYFVRQGFVHKLKIHMTDDQVDRLSKQINHYTLGIAQRVQEYCAELAYTIEENNWVYSEHLIKSSQEQWLKNNLRASYVVVESHLNSKETTIGRRNQVLYAIGRVSKHPFLASEIEDLIRAEFPGTIPETNMGIGSILSELSEPPKPILNKNDKSLLHYLFDPLYLMCIRLILKKNKTTGKIDVIRFKIN